MYSIMVSKALTEKQFGRWVQHLFNIDSDTIFFGHTIVNNQYYLLKFVGFL